MALLHDALRKSRAHATIILVVVSVLAVVFSCGRASADAGSDAITSLLSSGTTATSLFVPHFFEQYPVAPLNQLLADLHTRGGRLSKVDREGGAYVAHFANGAAMCEIVLDARNKIVGFYVLGFTTNDHPFPPPASNESVVQQSLNKMFQDQSVDLSLFADADLGTKISNNRDAITANLGPYLGVYFAHGSYFARFATHQIPIFVYMTSDNRIKSLWLYPPIPITSLN